MKKETIRMTAALLAVLSVSAVSFSACGEASGQPAGENTPNGSEEAAVTEAAETEDTIKDNLPALDYGGDTVKIHTFGWKDAIRFDGAGNGETGDVIDAAVYQRNLATEERLNMKLEFSNGGDDWAGFPTEIEKMVKAADCPYDMIFLESSQCFRLCLNGYFRELSNLPYIDQNQPWWYKEFMDGGSISTDSRYFLTGAFSITTLNGASCAIFNKRLFGSYFEDYNELYTLVENHQWTYDKLIEYCKAVYTDVNGDGKADTDDIYGFFNRGQQTVNYVSMSTGYRYLQRDKDNLPVLDLNNEDGIRWSEYMYRMLYEDNMSLTDAKQDGLVHFASGKSLFFLGMLSEYIKDEVRGMEDPHGVLPMPVVDEGMEYMSAAGTVNGMSAVLPVTTGDDRLDICAATLESLSIEAYRTVIPAWYDVALKSKYVDTERDSKMIDIIYNTIDTSFIMIADKLLGTGSYFYNMLVSSKKTPGEYVSYYEKQSKTILKKWDAMIESYLALEN